jgi:hypothetical protein
VRKARKISLRFFNTLQATYRSLDNVLSGAKSCGIKPVAASAIIERVASVFERRLEFYQQAKMQQHDIDLVEACVAPVD